MSENLVDKRQAAALLCCSVRQVDNLRIHGGLPWISVGQLVRFREEDVLAWIDQQCRTGAPNQSEQETKNETNGKEVQK